MENRSCTSAWERFFMSSSYSRESGPGQWSLQCPHKHAGDLTQHLQVMSNFLRCGGRIKLAMHLESIWTVCYAAVAHTSRRHNTEENIFLGVDFSRRREKAALRMVPLRWSDSKVHSDGDGGFSDLCGQDAHIQAHICPGHMVCPVPGVEGGVLIRAAYYVSCISPDRAAASGMLCRTWSQQGLTSSTVCG